MLLAQPLAVPCGVPTMESYLPLLSLKLAEDCQSGSARQGTVDLFRESFPDASISYVGCVQGSSMLLCRTRSGLRTLSPSDFGAAHAYAVLYGPAMVYCSPRQGTPRPEGPLFVPSDHISQPYSMLT